MESLITKKPAVVRWVNHLPSSSALLDKDLKLIDASTAWFKTFGFIREEVLGTPFMKLFPRLNENWQDSFDYAFEGLNDIKIVDVFLNQKQQEQELIWNINPWKDGYGNAVGIILNIKNVTKKKDLGLELKHTQKLLKEKSEIANIGSWDYNLRNKKLYWSKELKELFQLSHDHSTKIEDILGFFASEEEKKTIKELLHRAVNSGKPWNKNLRVKTKKGNIIWANTIGRPKFKNGKCVRIIGTIQNIQDSFVPEAAAKVSLPIKTTWEFINDLPVGTAIIDISTGKIVDLNHSLTNLLAVSKLTLLDKHFKNFLWFTGNEQRQWYKSLMVNNCIHGIEKEVFTKNRHQKIIVRIHGKRLKNTNFLLVSCEDVTAFHAKESLLQTKLSTANQELDKFTHFAHIASHNLKGHATNFDLLLNFLNNEQDEQERANLLNILFQSTESLTSSIKGLRELVTIRHQAKEDKTAVVLSDIVYKTLQNNNGLIKQHKVKIHNEVTDTFKVNGIPVYVESIISNLLINAIKFKNTNEKPYVIISAETINGFDVLSIEDNAVGVDLSKNGDKIFQLYKTLQNMDSTSGMGLYLAKYQIELMGGKIVVDSELGKGSNFKVYFPKNKESSGQDHGHGA